MKTVDTWIRKLGEARTRPGLYDSGMDNHVSASNWNVWEFLCNEYEILFLFDHKNVSDGHKLKENLIFLWSPVIMFSVSPNN